MSIHTNFEVAYIQCRSRQKDVCGLRYVCSVQAVVVGHVRVIVVLQGQHKCHKGVCWNLERPHQVSLLHVTQRGKNLNKQDLNSDMSSLTEHPPEWCSLTAKMLNIFLIHYRKD